MGELGSPSTGALAGAQADVKAVLGNTRQEPKRDEALLHATSVLVARAEHLIAEDDEMHARELENIEGHLGPFMEKLSVNPQTKMAVRSFHTQHAPTHFRSCTLTPETVHPDRDCSERRTQRM